MALIYEKVSYFSLALTSAYTSRLWIGLVKKEKQISLTHSTKIL